MKHWW